MANGIDVRIVGLPDFKARLRDLSVNMRKKVVRAGAMAAANVFKKAAVANAPVLTVPRKHRVAGTLKKSIFAGRSKGRSSDGVEMIVVGVRHGRKAGKTGRDAYYWRWVEDDHVPRGPGQRIRGGVRRRTLERNRLLAAGQVVPGTFFMKKAFDANKERAIAAFSARITARIEKASKEINRR